MPSTPPPKQLDNNRCCSQVLPMGVEPIVWFQKISIPPHGRSLEIPRGRGVQRQKFPGGVGGS